MNPSLIVALVMIVLGFGWSFRDWLVPAAQAVFARIRLPSLGGGGVSSDPDVADLQALKVVAKRYKRLECAEGQEAIKVLFAHFFHEAS